MSDLISNRAGGGPLVVEGKGEWDWEVGFGKGQG